MQSAAVWDREQIVVQRSRLESGPWHTHGAAEMAPRYPATLLHSEDFDEDGTDWETVYVDTDVGVAVDGVQFVDLLCLNCKVWYSIVFGRDEFPMELFWTDARQHKQDWKSSQHLTTTVFADADADFSICRSRWFPDFIFASIWMSVFANKFHQ